MFGEAIITRGIENSRIPDKFGNEWQYHSRSDRHSKLACWAILFDLLIACPLLRRHASELKVFFGINHEMRDFRVNRKKNLDLVLCSGSSVSSPPKSFWDYGRDLGIGLLPSEAKACEKIPPLFAATVTTVLVALEAKACMTAHIKARPRLYDELASSFQTIHGDTNSAIAGGFVMVNGSERFLSSDRNRSVRHKGRENWNKHTQPKDALSVLGKIRELPRRSDEKTSGFDAIGVSMVSFQNDGSRVLVDEKLAAAVDPILGYESLVQRLAHLYATKFNGL